MAKSGVLRYVVREVTGVAAGKHVCEHLGRHLRSHLVIVSECAVALAQQRFGLESGLRGRFRFAKELDRRVEILVRRKQSEHSRAGLSLYHHAHIAVRHAQYLAYVRDRADVVQILFRRRVNGYLALRDEENILIPLHRLFKRVDRHRAFHVKMHKHIREYSHSAKCQHRQICNILFHCKFSFPTRLKSLRLLRQRGCRLPQHALFA
ncbi:hypothetical protein SDC9_157172 [bioreactor metagenome]|uniref:Uncharacterized protein n=1 Tax=bioreactor metagenome TaxID=1076179 RepID=A0A645F968_9ZZZZ